MSGRVHYTNVIILRYVRNDRWMKQARSSSVATRSDLIQAATALTLSEVLALAGGVVRENLR